MTLKCMFVGIHSFFFEVRSFYIPRVNSTSSNPQVVVRTINIYMYLSTWFKSSYFREVLFWDIKVGENEFFCSRGGIKFPSTITSAHACYEWTFKSKFTNLFLHVHEQHTENCPRKMWLSYGTSILNCFHLHLEFALTQRTFSDKFFLTSTLSIQCTLRLTPEPSASLVAEKILSSSTVFL